MNDTETLRGGGAVDFSKRDLQKLILPLIVEQVLVITVGLADSVMVASVSNAAVSAVSLVDSVSNLIIYIFAALATGGAVVAGQYLGRRDQTHAREAAEQLTVTVAVLSLLIMAALYLLKGFVLHRVFGKIEPDVALATDQYYSIVMASVPFIALYNAGAALMRMIERSDVTFKVSLLMNVINLGGNAVLIYVFRMGVRGAAIPTLVSRIAAAAVILGLLMKKELPLTLRSISHCRFRPQMVKNILAIGLPNGVENGMFHFGRLILTSLISSLGTASIVANAIGNTVGNFQICAATAVGLGLTTVASQCIGAGRYDKAREYTRKLLKLDYAILAVINVLIIVCIPLINRIYHISGETVRLTFWVVVIHGAAAIAVYPLSFTLPNTLRSAGDVRFAMIVSTCSMWLCRVALGYVFALSLGMGVIGIYTSHAMDWCVRSACFYTRYRGKKWQHTMLE